MNNNYIAFDIGGTEIKYGILTDSAEILLKNSFKSQRASVDHVFSDIVVIINEYKDKYNLSGIAFSLPGIVDVNTGIVPFMGAITLNGPVNIKNYFEAATGLPVELENDANCATLAELWKGAGQNSDNFVCFTIGTGIGGGIVINRELYRGKQFSAGEFGMMYNDQPEKMITENSSMYRKGVPEEWSAQGSMYFVVKRMQEQIGNEQLTGAEIFDKAVQGLEPFATEVARFYHANAIGIHNLWVALNPEKIIIGGGISARGTELVEKLEKELVDMNRIAVMKIPPDVITVCDFANDAGIIGATYHFLHTRKLI